MKNSKFILLVLIIDFIAILFVYQSAFKLELQGDSWHYVWGHMISYGNNVFSKESLQGMRSSLGGASLTFGLIENHFGPNSLVFYSVSVLLKFFTIIPFFFLVMKLTNNNLASFIASLILSVSFVGVEATHWVFNMYAYIGLILITLSFLIGIDLPSDYKFKKWLLSFILASVGVWYATMRTNGIIPLIIVWSFYKFITLKSKSSSINLASWVIGFAVFIIIDKFLLGQMETDYSQKHIIGAGLQAFQTQIANSKYDFIFSPAANLGSTILPDVTWISFNFPKVFSLFGSGVFGSVVLPSLIIFTIISWILTAAIKRGSEKVFPKFSFLFFLGLIWTLIVNFTLLLGPANFSSWVALVLALFGGYFMIFCLYLVISEAVPSNLKSLFLLSFLWSFVFLLVPEFQNGGPILGTYQRYMVTTALAVPMFMAGLITLSSVYKNNLLRNLTLIIIFLMIFTHATQTKAFFDRKAIVHNRELAAKIWQQFTTIVPNKAQYMKNDDTRVDLTGNGRAPTLWFESSDNPIDRETLFESLYFAFLLRTSVKYGWYVHSGTGLYYENYNDLVKDIKKNPKLLDEFYAVRMENQSLIDITEIAKQKIAEDVKNLP